MADKTEREKGRWPFGVMLTGLLLALALLLFAAYVVSPPRPATAGTIDPRQSGGELSDLARTLLHTKMEAHRTQMQRLTMATVLLRYDEIAKDSSSVVDEPMISRNRTAPGQLNAELPEQFFVVQDQLRGAARKLSAAAQQRDDAAIADSYGQLSGTCIACHATYLPRAH